jgi:hypothetical protein
VGERVAHLVGDPDRGAHRRSLARTGVAAEARGDPVVT